MSARIRALIAAFGGLASRMPVYSRSLASSCSPVIGLPGMSGFIGEFLVPCGLRSTTSGWRRYHLRGGHLRRLVHDVDVPAGRLRTPARDMPDPADNELTAEERAAGARMATATAHHGHAALMPVSGGSHDATTITATMSWPDLTPDEVWHAGAAGRPDDLLRRLSEADLRHLQPVA